MTLFGPKRKVIVSTLRVKEGLNYPGRGIVGPNYQQVKHVALDMPSDLKQHVPHMMDTILTSRHSTPLVNAVASMERTKSQNALKRSFYRALASTGRFPPDRLGEL